jgi:isopenicillin-N N-acyltransferase-like protein
MTQFPIIETKGLPYEVGYQHGNQVREKVKSCLDRFCPVSERTRQRRRIVAKIEDTVASQMPEAIEEMRGIAEGSGLNYEDILLLNLSVELWGEGIFSTSPGCTLIGIAGEDPLVAKTIDMIPGDDQNFICQIVRPTYGYPFLHITYAGTIWTDGGINSAGLAQTNSTLQSNGCDWSNFPIFIMTRHLLQYCRNVSEAVDFASHRNAINQGSNILLGDADNNLVVLEKSIRQGIRYWEEKPKYSGQIGKVIYATNHSVTPQMEKYLSGSEYFLANSRERFENLAHLVGQIDNNLMGVMTMYRDHTPCGGLCQHGQAGLHTIGAFITLPKQKNIWITRGYPCKNEFYMLNL